MTAQSIDAVLFSFAMVFLFTLWLGKRIESRFVLHGALVGVVGMLLFGIMRVATTGSLAQPPLYVVAHLLKVFGGITSGLVVERRRRRVLRGRRSTGRRLTRMAFERSCKPCDWRGKMLPAPQS